MEEDKLKKFVQDNRDSFDNEKAPSKVWTEIDKELNARRKENHKIFKYIGLFVFTMILFWGGWYLGQQENTISNDKIEESIHHAQILQKENIPPELNELEHYYGNIINEKKSKIEQVNYAVNVDEQLSGLNESYDELMEDFISKNGDEELLIHYMIENYKLRIRILEMTLDKSRLRVEHDTSFNPKDIRYEY